MTGYKGRFAVTETLLTTPELERMIASAAPLPELTATARRAGTRSLWASGITRLLDLDTTVDEVMRVLEPDRLTMADEAPPLDDLAELVDGARMAEYDMSHVDLSPREGPPMTDITVGVVDVYIIDPSCTPWRTLTLQRGTGTRCPGAWEAVHGRIEAGEKPEEAAVRELREETGLVPQRLYNVTVHSFYLHTLNRVEMAVVFCAFVDSKTPVTLGNEHQGSEWLPLKQASERFIWPRATQALREIHKLLGGGNAGPAEDVLRVM